MQPPSPTTRPPPPSAGRRRSTSDQPPLPAGRTSFHPDRSQEQEQVLRAHRRQWGQYMRSFGCDEWTQSGEWFAGTSLAEDWQEDFGEMFGTGMDVEVRGRGAGGRCPAERSREVREVGRAERSIAKVRKGEKRPPRPRAGKSALRQKKRVAAAAPVDMPSPRPTASRRTFVPARAELEGDFEMARRLQKEAYGLRNRRGR